MPASAVRTIAVLFLVGASCVHGAKYSQLDVPGERVQVESQVQLINALCNSSIGLISMRSNITLDMDAWPTVDVGPAPCIITRNTTVTGTGYNGSMYGPFLDLAFASNILVVKEGHFLCLHNLTAVNTRW